MMWIMSIYKSYMRLRTNYWHNRERVVSSWNIVFYLLINRVMNLSTSMRSLVILYCFDSLSSINLALMVHMKPTRVCCFFNFKLMSCNMALPFCDFYHILAVFTLNSFLLNFFLLNFFMFYFFLLNWLFIYISLKLFITMIRMT